MSTKRKTKPGRQSSILAFFGSGAPPAPTPKTAPGLSSSAASSPSEIRGSGTGTPAPKRALFTSGRKRRDDDVEGVGSGEGTSGRKVRRIQVDEDEEDGGVMELDGSGGDGRDGRDGGNGEEGGDGGTALELFQAGSDVMQPRSAKARKVLDALDMSGGYGSQEGDWTAKNGWSVDVRDAGKRKPSEEGYDPSTLFIPSKVLEKMSPFQRQFWELKSRYYDTMLFVKKGAFMEAYDVDADIVHRELGLNYTGGGRASMRCAGVPESSLNKHAARLIDLGYRVGIVAQTETANAADKRKNKVAGKKVSGKDAVCQRSLVRILTKATITDDELLRDHRARYVIALHEAPASTVSAAGEVVVGVCYVDAAAGRITIGEFLDDSRRSWSEKLLSTLRPPEVLVSPLNELSKPMRALVRWVATGATHVEVLHRGGESGFPAMTSERLEIYPGAAENVSRGYLAGHPLASRALGAVAQYLAELLIDKETLSLGNYVFLPDIEFPSDVAAGASQESKDTAATGGSAASSACAAAARGPLPSHAETCDDGYDPTRAVGGGLAMDAATMANLEVLANVVDGSERGTLVSVIDRAATASGRRLLRRWIADPLTLSAAINDRLNAVDELLAIEHAIPAARRSLASGPDLERALARLHQFAVVSDVAVMFDDTNSRRVKDFLNVLRGLETTLTGLEALAEELPTKCSARRLTWLLKPGGGYTADARKELDFFFKSCFDVRAAEKDGEIQPMTGAAPAYDVAKEALDSIEDDLETELKRWQRELKDKSIEFYHRGKESYQLDVPCAVVDRNGVPREFTPTSESKKTKRFHTARIQALVRKHVDASETFADAGVNVLRDIVTRFDDKRDVWSGVVKAASEVDALMGLALASQGDGSGPMVKPVVLPDSYPVPLYDSVELRHPVLAAKAGSCFVANDTVLGGEGHSIALVTGSNCSGKSTLQRQVAASVILAQVGCYVPAKAMKLRPFDSMFARAGSRDEIARGRSTFMVEMEEAALILNTASSRYALEILLRDRLLSRRTVAFLSCTTNDQARSFLSFWFTLQVFGDRG